MPRVTQLARDRAGGTIPRSRFLGLCSRSLCSLPCAFSHPGRVINSHAWESDGGRRVGAAFIHMSEGGNGALHGRGIGNRFCDHPSRPRPNIIAANIRSVFSQRPSLKCFMSFSKCGPWTRSIRITWMQVILKLSHQTCRIRNSEGGTGTLFRSSPYGDSGA